VVSRSGDQPEVFADLARGVFQADPVDDAFLEGIGEFTVSVFENIIVRLF